MKLRDYQQKCVNDITPKGRNLVHLATGAGKSLVFKELARLSLKRNEKVLFMVAGTSILDQAVKKHFSEISNNIGYMQGSRKFEKKEILCASIDTLSRRKSIHDELIDYYDTYIIDECFLGDVEVLTEEGFQRFDSLNKTLKIAQFDQETENVSFAVPVRYIEKKYRGLFVNFKSKRNINITMTEGHELLVKNRVTYKKEKIKAKDFNSLYKYNLFSAGKNKPQIKDPTPREKLCLALQADGYVTKTEGLVHFQFSKERKIKELLSICSAGGFKIKEWKPSEKKGNIKKRRRFGVWFKNPSKNLWDVFNLSKISPEKARGIIKEAMMWDGHIYKTGTLYFSSADKRQVDFYQSLCVLAGYTSSQSVQVDKRKKEFSDIFRLYINTKTNEKGFQHIKKTTFKKTEEVYCVQVPKGNIIIRTNGRTTVIGNCHNCTSKRYTDFLEKIKDKTVIGLTATPYLVGKKGHSYWEKVIHPISVLELIKQKHLVFPKCFSAKIVMDTKVKKMGGDYNNKELFEKNDKPAIYGSIVDEYIEKFFGKKAICFGINVKHSKLIRDEFLRRGIKAVHADAETSIYDRSLVLSDFEHGDTLIVCNVNIFSTGIDTPCAEVGIMARPTKSKILWIQQVGRLLRPFPGKKFAYIMDHGNNIVNIGHPLNDFPAELEDGKSSDENDFKTYQCKSCFYVYSEDTKTCPNCGEENKAVEQKEIARIEAEMIEVKYQERKRARDERIIEWANWITYKTNVYFLAYLKAKTTTRVKEYIDVSDSIPVKESIIFKELLSIFEKAYSRNYKKVSVMFNFMDFCDKHQGVDASTVMKIPGWALNREKK